MTEYEKAGCAMPIGEPFEDEFGEALRRTGDSFDPLDGGTLVDGGLRRGRRRVVRRRAGVVAVSALALAAVGVGGAYGGGLWGGLGDGRRSVAAPVQLDKPGSVGEMTGILRGLLPPGKLTDTQGRGTDGSKSGAYVSGVFDDGKGKAAVSVSLSRANGKDDAQLDCPVGPTPDDVLCNRYKLDGGQRLTVFQGYEYPDRRETTKAWRAVLLTTDGFLVQADEYNAPAEKGELATRPEPPLDPAQLRALVTSADWQGPLGRLPGKPVDSGDPGAAGATEDTGPAIRKLLLSMLPRGLKVTDKGGEGDYQYVVVDDGQGASLVDINVQEGMGDVRGDLFGDGSTTLPDGTEVQTNKRPGEKGGAGVVWWTADTMRPDGFRVVISAFNTGDQNSPATRKEPALTMKQLTAMATDKRWLTLR